MGEGDFDNDEAALFLALIRVHKAGKGMPAHVSPYNQRFQVSKRQDNHFVKTSKVLENSPIVVLEAGRVTFPGAGFDIFHICFRGVRYAIPEGTTIVQDAVVSHPDLGTLFLEYNKLLASEISQGLPV